VFAIPRDVLGISLLRSLYLSARFGARIIVLRGTRLRLERGARIQVPRGCRLLIGKSHVAGGPASLHMMRNARLTVHGQGRATISRGARILIMKDARLEIGGETTIHCSTTVTCFKHISIGQSCAISWNVNILDGNLHELIVDGVPHPRSKPVTLGGYVWIGCGATILGASIGAGAVVGAGSVVVSDVPEKAVVAGNPARIIRKNVTWVI
jgi:acetyltransferase-like isoleucine patch superfamily enzyme